MGKTLLSILAIPFLWNCSSVKELPKIKPLSSKQDTVYVKIFPEINPLDCLSGNKAYLESKSFYDLANLEFYAGNDSTAREYYSKATKLLSQSDLSAEDWESLDYLTQIQKLENLKEIKTELESNGINVSEIEIEEILKQENYEIGEQYAKEIAKQEKILETKHKKWFLNTLEKFLQYEPFLDSLSKSYNLDEIFKYSFPIESAMNPESKSNVGAKGIAQWMKSSAEKFGLKIETGYDERLDPIKSLEAAFKYYSFLFSDYDDPDLAISGYNCGEGKINKELERNNSTTYNELFEKKVISKETRNHLPKIHAFKNLRKKMKLEESQKDPILEDLLTGNFYEVKLDQQTSLSIMAKIIGLSKKEFQKYNPSYTFSETPRNKINQEYDYYIRIPKNNPKKITKEEFQTELSKVKKRVIAGEGRYKIQKGDTLSEIARKYHMSTRELKQINGLTSEKIITGKTLRVISK